VTSETAQLRAFAEQVRSLCENAHENAPWGLLRDLLRRMLEELDEIEDGIIDAEDERATYFFEPVFDSEIPAFEEEP
jgi:hypothetical protein